MKSKFSCLLLLVFTSISFQDLLANQGPPGKVLWQIEQQFVSLVSQDNAAAPRNDHPASVPIDTLAEMLYVVSVSERKSRFSFGGKKTDLGAPLFSDYEIDILSQSFSDAIKSATPQQDILFRIHGGKEQLGGITARKTINTGRAFWRDNHLHIIFGEVHGGDKTKWLYGQKQDEDYKRRFGSRTSASDRVKIVFAPVPGIAQYKDNNDKIRTDWITIDPDIILGKASEVEQSAVSPQQNISPAKVAAPADSKQHLSLKQRLVELKELREEGLVSEEIYQQKVKDLIDESY